MNDYPLHLPAIKIEQPLGIFYVVALSAEVLLKTSYTIRAEILEDGEEEGFSYLGKTVNKLKGNQRLRANKRLNEIKRYTETVDASFPNSIILGANFHEDGTLVTTLENRWEVVELDCGHYELVIPTEEKLASIIDGQHRVFGFTESNAKGMMLPCSVFIDLPLPYHAKIFTNININQKRVDKNLAYNLFQFDMEQGNPSSWSPETLAVYFARVLAKEDDSPLKNRIKLGVLNSTSDTSISMASIIDGILALITNNPKNDRELLHRVDIKERSRKLLENVTSSAPLRDLYMNNKDKSLYNIILKYFNALAITLWKEQVFLRTLGIHASFDFLKEISKIKGVVEISSLQESDFVNILKTVELVDFSNPFFGIQSKLRTRLKNTMLEKSGFKTIDELSCSDEDKITIELLSTIF